MIGDPIDGATALWRAGRRDEALGLFRSAARSSSDPLTHHLHGEAAELSARDAEAGAAYRRALALDPGFHAARARLGTCHLRAGAYAEGWWHYEARLLAAGFSTMRAVRDRRRWSLRSRAGRRVLIHGEQGRGDSIFFARYVPLLAEFGAEALVFVQPELERLFAGLPGVATLLRNGQAMPEFDEQIPFASLPGALGTTVETIPDAVPYLGPPDDVLARWRGRLSGSGRSIGLVWSGNTAYDQNDRRSLPFETLRHSLAGRGYRLFALQVGPPAAEASGTDVTPLGPELTDFAETAGAILALDGVVTVDTSVANLAGALGAPACVLLHDAPDWRWGLSGGRTPWYPTLKLFRQRRPGDWSEPVGAASQALTAA